MSDKLESERWQEFLTEQARNAAYPRTALDRLRSLAKRATQRDALEPNRERAWAKMKDARRELGEQGRIVLALLDALAAADAMRDKREIEVVTDPRVLAYDVARARVEELCR